MGLYPNAGRVLAAERETGEDTFTEFGRSILDEDVAVCRHELAADLAEFAEHLVGGIVKLCGQCTVAQRRPGVSDFGADSQRCAAVVPFQSVQPGAPVQVADR